MTGFRRFQAWQSFALSLAVASSVGCVNSKQFTSGRLPYGGDQVASASPHDPFLSSGVNKAAEPTRVADASQLRAQLPSGNYANPAAYMPTTNAMSEPAVDMAYGRNAMAEQTAPSMTRQAAYVPTTNDNPFAVSRAPGGAESQYSPPQMSQPPMSPPAIEQISFEMPVGMPAEDPFAEVQRQPGSVAMPQTIPTNDAWQPRVSSTTSFSADEFVPPR